MNVRRNAIRRIGDLPQAHYTIVPNEMLRCGLSSEAVHMGALVRSHVDGYEISQRSLAEDLGRSRNTVAKYWRELIDARWLAVTEYKTAEGKRAYEEYYIHVGRRFTEAEMAEYNRTVALPGVAQKMSQGWLKTCAGGGSKLAQGVAQKLSHKEDHSEDQEEEQSEDQAAVLAELDRIVGSGAWISDEPPFGNEPRRWIDEDPGWGKRSPTLGPDPFQTNKIEPQQPRCHSPGCDHEPILNCRWCYGHLGQATAITERAG